MKKNIAMRLASGLMLSCLLSTCVISGTFAKYTTSVDGQDTARVATWGFNGQDADIALTDLFMTAYNNVGGTADVIAPGTTNSATFKFVYTAGTTDVVEAPEVAYTLTVSTDGSECADDIKNNANIKWAVLKTTELEEGNVPAGQWNTWDAMIAKIEGLDGAPGDTAYTYDAQVLAPISNEEYTVAWKWDFFTNDDADEEDTKMGNAADLADVKLVITITATQID